MIVQAGNLRWEPGSPWLCDNTASPDWRPPVLLRGFIQELSEVESFSLPYVTWGAGQCRGVSQYGRNSKKASAMLFSPLCQKQKAAYWYSSVKFARGGLQSQKLGIASSFSLEYSQQHGCTWKLHSAAAALGISLPTLLEFWVGSLNWSVVRESLCRLSLSFFLCFLSPHCWYMSLIKSSHANFWIDQPVLLFLLYVSFLSLFLFSWLLSTTAELFSLLYSPLTHKINYFLKGRGKNNNNGLIKDTVSPFQAFFHFKTIQQCDKINGCRMFGWKIPLSFPRGDTVRVVLNLVYLKADL